MKSEREKGGVGPGRSLSRLRSTGVMCVSKDVAKKDVVSICMPARALTMGRGGRTCDRWVVVVGCGHGEREEGLMSALAQDKAGGLV